MIAEVKGNIEGSTYVLNDVLFVTELSKNLLSVNFITEKDGEVHFTREKVIIKKNGYIVKERKWFVYC